MTEAAAPPAATSLWGPSKLEIIGVAGEFDSGKTLFGCSIDPPRTIVYDWEKSSANYEGLGIATRVDVPAELQKKFPNGYTPVQAWLWWRDHVRSLPAGKYSVCFVDPFSDLEQGFTDWVSSNPKEFGRTDKQYEKSAGLMWGDLKNYQNAFLLDLGSRVETFVFACHMRDVFKGGIPTGQREPKGKETLMKIASCYILLERKPDATGTKPGPPTGIVLKSRLAHTSWDAATRTPKIVPILPPRLKEATPEAIRKYIATPPNYDKLKASEKLQIVAPTEEQVLDRKQQIATTELAVEEARVTRLQMIADAAKANGQLIEKTVAGVAAASAQQVVNAVKEAATTEVNKTAESGPPDTSKNDLKAAYIESAEMLEKQLGMSEAGRKVSYHKRGFASLQAAPDAVLADYVTALRKKLEEKNSAAPKG